jgi:hypothetical protein
MYVKSVKEQVFNLRPEPERHCRRRGLQQ